MESVSHSRSLSFLKPLMNGPYFDLEVIWDEHTYWEFENRSVENTMNTMVQEPYVNHVPTVITFLSFTLVKRRIATNS
jgi:carboxymethylenebutenolidase